MADARRERELTTGYVSTRRGLGIGAIRLGDVIKAITTRLGIKPCAACEERAERLNRLFRS